MMTAAGEDGSISFNDYVAIEYNCYFKLSTLNELVEKSPSELLNFLNSKRSEFLSLLKDKSAPHDLLSAAIIVLGQTCVAETYLRKHLMDFMLPISSFIDLIALNFQRWLVLLYEAKNLSEHDLHAMHRLTIFLRTFQSFIKSSFDVVSILLPLLYQACDKCLKKDEKLQRIVSEQLEEIKRESERKKINLLEPPENFRSLSILPTAEDVEKPCSFLRPNLFKGNYKDTEHYLDVQFRLLREDYIKPLRDGVTEYLNINKKNQTVKRLKDARIYNVNVVSEKFVDGELMRVLKFRDAFFTKIKWESCKRLMYGNLLCLSADNFRSMLFATVVNRDKNELRRGLLTVKFEEKNAYVFDLKSAVNFVVIETTGLFEAYRHNLSVLQRLDEDSMSMKRYIVDVEKKVKSPEYLKPTTKYDMTCLLLPLDVNLDNKDKKKLVNVDKMLGKFSVDVISKCESVTVTDIDSWPTASMLNMENSQYLALKSAVTKEFSLIQGPPGTGKTYIGLKTVQLLLHNIDQWFFSNSDTFPILVVCQTNHALDQFLEGISKLTKEIARIGGRISNENLNQFSMYERVRSKRRSRNRGGIFFRKWEKIDKLKKKIDTVNYWLDHTLNHVLDEFDLQKHMPPAHFEFLRDFTGGDIEHCKSNMFDWLEISSIGGIFPEQEFTNETNLYNVEYNTDDEIESECEADVEFIENERNVDFYDFNDTRIFEKSSLHFEKFAERRKDGWRSQMNKIKLENFMRQNLRKYSPMERNQALGIIDVWTLNNSERWQLYKFWLDSFIKEKREEYINLQQELKVAFQESARIRIEEDLYALKDIHVVGMTTTGAAKYRHIIDCMNPVILIVEEAAEILESHIVTSLAPKTQHVILIGDQEQLRPTPTVHMLAVEYNMDVSLFERMIENGMDFCRLCVQHRMRPEIAALIVPHIYLDLKNHETVTEFEHIKGMCKDVFFVTHAFDELAVKDSKSKTNLYEAKFILKLCRYLLQQGYKRSQITVLTTYSGQLFALRKLAVEQGLITKKPRQKHSNISRKVTKEVEDSQSVRFTVVDSYQGEENDIILISFVRSNKEGVVGFLKVSNRVCVALSRARKGLFCIGNFELLARKSKLWENITQKLSEVHSIGKSLFLVCQNHPDTISEIENEQDFVLVPEGGCNRKCEYQLNCGHSCILYCHPYNKSHENITCKEPCRKVCKNRHQCPKRCFEVCGMCEVFINRVLTRCGHTVNAPCGEDDINIICENPCKETCKNNHPCPKKCFEDCGMCKVFIDRVLTWCGHTVNAPCGEDERKIECKNPCKELCKNNHPCPKKCFEVCGMCKVFIDRVLTWCGHTVNAPCGEGERKIKCKNPCKEMCKSNHPCLKKCFEVCGMCKVLINRVLTRCGHTVHVLCGADERKIKCENPCSRTCPRNHPCAKKCFEYCLCEIFVDKPCSKCGFTSKIPCNKFSYAKCENSCNKICENGHPCQKKCFENCYCDVVIEKTLKRCGHILKAPCGKPEKMIKCTSKCLKVLPCLHQCDRKCSEPCIVKCRQKTQFSVPACGHSIEDACFMRNYLPFLNKKCIEPCKMVLPCGHTCKGTCSGCKKSGTHVKCKQVCKKLLSCGHECPKKCCDSCALICRKIVNIESPCGYYLEAECFLRKYPDELSKRCTACKKLLPDSNTASKNCRKAQSTNSCPLLNDPKQTKSSKVLLEHSQVGEDKKYKEMQLQRSNLPRKPAFGRGHSRGRINSNQMALENAMFTNRNPDTLNDPKQIKSGKVLLEHSQVCENEKNKETQLQRGNSTR